MKFDVKEVLVARDRVDIQTIRDGKLARTYHLENWLGALGQLRAK